MAVTKVCEDIAAVLGSMEYCFETEYGARVVTHCLYPSFDQVEIYIHKWGDGYRVTDAGQASSVAWSHGRDRAAIMKALDREARRHGLTVAKGALVVEIPSLEWLASGMLAVANASAAAAYAVVSRAAGASSEELSEQIYEALIRLVARDTIQKDLVLTGRSGSEWRVDYAVSLNDNAILVNAVSPHPHSVNQKYAEFGDLPEEAVKFAVHDGRLKPAQALLIEQVATPLSVVQFEAGARRALIR